MAFTKDKVKFYSPLSLGQRRTLNLLLGEINQSMRDGGVDAYDGTIVPDANALESASYDYAAKVGGRARASRDQEAERGILKLLSGDPAFDVDPTARRELYDAERADALRRFGEETIPLLTRAYGAKGAARSGALTYSLGNAATRLEDDLYRRNTELLLHDEDMRRNELAAARDRIATGVGADAQARQNQALDFGTLLTAGNAQRAVTEAQNKEAYSKWLQEQPWANPWLGFTNAALGAQTNAPYVGSETDWLGVGMGVLNLAGSVLGSGGGGMMGG